MRRLIISGVILAAFSFSASAQDWHQQRKEQIGNAEQWRLHLFAHVREDLDHVWAGVAKDKELERLTKTEDELTKMQADLDQTRWDNGLLNDVIDSISKSSNDTRLQAADRTVLSDDVRRLKEFQDQHQHTVH
jgi:cell shape-determining protein MreC